MWFQAGMQTVASGHWGKTSWALGVSESNGIFCSSVSLSDKAGTTGCGGINSAERSHLLLYGWSSSYQAPKAVIRGYVVVKATRVVITLSDGKKIRATTIPPPPGLAPDIGFFIAPFPCGTYPKAGVGLDGSGNVVASWPPASFPAFPQHPASCGHTPITA